MEVETASSGQCQWQRPPSLPPMTGPMIEVEQVTKRFGPMLVLDRIDLCADRGQVVALLGPTGPARPPSSASSPPSSSPTGDGHGSAATTWSTRPGRCAQ